MIQASAINDFLVQLATTLSQASAFDPETVDAVAKQSAEAVAEKYGADPVALMQSVPKAWRENASSGATRDQIKAFLAIATPVLGAHPADSAATVRGIATASQMTRAIAINQAHSAEQSTTPAQQTTVDFAKETKPEVLAKFEAVVRDPNFQARMGGKKYGEYIAYTYRRGYNAEGIDAIWEPDKKSTGRFVELTSLPLRTTAGEFARALVEAEAVSSFVQEADFNSSLVGSKLVSGHSPGYSVYKLAAHISGEKVSIGLNIDVDAAKQWGFSLPYDDAELVRRLEGILDATRTSFVKRRAEGIPPLVVSDGYYS